MRILLSSFFCVAALGASLWAQQPAKAAVAFTLPPYINQETGDGMDVDVVRDALKIAGADLQLDFVPFARVPMNIRDGVDDLAFPITEASGVTNVSYSDSYMTYQNVAVALKDSGLRITRPRDLRGRSVLAFQDATVYLGDEFKEMSKDNDKYQEIANQELQVKLLFAKRAEVIVMDVNIFKYFRQRMTGVDSNQEVVVFQLFPPSEYKVAFRDKTLCDRFNAGLKKLRDSGRYAEIVRKYIK